LKWIGQHIVDLIARFRSDVYLDSPTAGGSDPDKFLGIDSNNKIIYRTGAEVASDIGASGDITGVTIAADDENTVSDTAGNVDFTIAGGAGIDTSASSTTITIAGETASASNAGIVELATIAETNTGTDTGRAVTPDGLNDWTGGAGAITKLGTIATGVWQGTTIKTAYIGDDQVTEDKLANTLLAEIDANTAKATNVTTNLTATTHASQITINSSDGTNVVVAEASGSIAGVMSVTHHDKLDAIEASATADQSKSDIDGLAITTVGTIDTGVWNGTVIAQAYIAGDAINGDKIADDAIDSEHYTDGSIDNAHIADDAIDSEHYADGSIDTAHIADDQVTFAKAVGITPNIYGSIIKVLPSDFMANEEPGVTKTLQFVDNDVSGIKPGDNGTELLAFVSIPETMKATHVDVYADANLAFSAYELDIHESVGDISAASKGTGTCNTTLDITDVNATATNYLLIQVITVAKADRVWGAKVTIAAQ
tara:strand:- start:109 stop:1557 length:1449 start_codon:yes stop_codon:yes gene_type:complete